MALILTVGLAACGSDDGDAEGSGASGEEENKTIAVSQFTREVPYFRRLVEGMRAQASELGWELELSYANSDPKQQINQLTNAVTKQPDGIVVSPIDEDAIVPPIRQAKAAGIPVITTGDDIAQEARNARATFVGVDYEELGRQKAQLIIDELGGKGKVGMIHAVRGLNFTEQQNTGAKAAFKANPGIELVDGPYAGVTPDDGLKATENLLARAPDLDAIYFDNDNLSLGGIKAVEERGIRHDDILLVGTNGDPPAIEAVEKGTLDFSVNLCGFAQGKEVLEVLHGLLIEGRQLEPVIRTETEVLTQSNIEEQKKKLEAGEC